MPAVTVPAAPGPSRPAAPWLKLDPMDAGTSDEELMLAYGRGDAAAFEALYARHRGGLFRFVLRGLTSRALAEEVFQETWARVIAARVRYRPEAKFSTWLYQIAHNLVVDSYRRTRPEHGGEKAELQMAQQPAPEGEQPDRELSEFERRRQLQLALEQLPEEQRLVVQLRLEQELSLEQIGEITGVGRETVKSRLRYAMDKLRSTLSP